MKAHAFLAWSPPGESKLSYFHGEIVEGINPQTQFVFAPFDASSAHKAHTMYNLERIGEEEFYGHLKESNSVENMVKEDYCDLVTEAKETILASGILKKVIVSRSYFQEKLWDLQEVLDRLKRLTEAMPNAMVYLFSHPTLGTWLGASPEVLVEKKDDRYKTMALAGSRKTSDREEWGDKEVEEQAMVEDFFEQRMEAYAFPYYKDGPKTSIAGPVAHILSEYRFKAVFPWDKMVDIFHPSPAISGLPQVEAMSWIRDHEGYDRRYYCGYFGMIAPENMAIFINLRCAEIFTNGIKYYIGGGITATSDPEKEWAETALKRRTLAQFFD